MCGVFYFIINWSIRCCFIFGFQALCRVSRLSAPHVRNFASEPQKITGHLAVDQKLPEGLHPRFYALKENQKIYQVCWNWDAIYRTIILSHDKSIHSNFIFSQKFQKPDGVPIHLKRGMRDKVPYYATWVAIFVGLGLCAEFVYSLP